MSYQPDWLRQVKVTRVLETGRQSTKTLVTNPADPEADPGRQVRTEIRSREQGLSFGIIVTDPGRVVRRVIVETGPADASVGRLAQDGVQFTIDTT